MKYLKIFKYFSITENRFERRDEEQYKNCFMSDLVRMELIETFLNKVQNDPSYNKEEPNYSKLVDDWDGYDDQVYIQNNLDENEIIYWEGWVDECWKSLFQKPDYKGLSKTECIKKVITQRFPRIAEEFGFKIKDFDYFDYEGEYIMKVIFERIDTLK